MSTPKISIITVCYNSSLHLEECMQSIINQSYENKEYIVIDGGSKDGTLDIINKYRDKIDYFVSEPDKGISDAFNKGIKAATGDIIGIINSDDFMMPDALQKVAEQYEEGVDLYRGYTLVWNEVRNTKKYMYPNHHFAIPPCRAMICHESSFITPGLYQRAGLYKVDFKYEMDLDLFVRFYKFKDLKVKMMNICVMTFRTGGTSSAPAAKMKNERIRLIKENGGTNWDVLVFLGYHQAKYMVKITYWTLSKFMKKIFGLK
jgi:glycosyltransferase involved in cell wall biosynthesis